MHALSSRLQGRIKKLGFASYGTVDISQIGEQNGQRLACFLDNNYHASMAWMRETQHRRAHPLHLWPKARSALVLGFNYGPEENPLDKLSQPLLPNISVYAQNRDYHNIIKGRLKEIAGLLASETNADVKVFVDTAPLMEKPLAQQARLGWQGKHTNLVSRDFGSWLFLGVILSAATLAPFMTPLPAEKISTTSPIKDSHCGSCQACLDICPTNAFPAPYQLDARLCISYLTIEHAGEIDVSLRRALGNRIYGCDDCLAVCPWNKFAKQSQEIKLRAPTHIQPLDLIGLSQLDAKEFGQRFRGSPVKRIGFKRFLRNVLYALGNAGRQAQTQKMRDDIASALHAHQADEDSVIRNAVLWGLAEISS